MRVRPAVGTDLPAIHALLAEADLPTADVSLELGPFVVAEDRAGIVGSAGVQRLDGDVSLLRSVATRAADRDRGIATWLCAAAVEAARRERVERLFLLTASAPGFFRRLGFTPVRRSAAPPAVAATREFRELCPDSATFMWRRVTSPTSSLTVTGLRAVYEALFAGAPSAYRELLDARMVYHLPGSHLGGGRLDGVDAVLGRAGAAARACDAPPTMLLLEAYGDEHAVVTTERLSAHRAGRVLDQRVHVVWRFERSRCVEAWSHFEDQPACDAFWDGWRRPA